MFKTIIAFIYRYWNIWQASKSPAAKKGMHRTLWLLAAFRREKRYSDLPADFFHVEDWADISQYRVAVLSLYEAERFMENGDYQEAMKILEKVQIDKLPSLLQGETKAKQIYYYLIPWARLGTGKRTCQL